MARRASFTPEQIYRFLSLALITHKYGFASLESWAREFLDLASLSRPNMWASSKPSLSLRMSHENLLRLRKYAKLANHTQLREAILDQMIQRIEASPRTLDLVDALQIAENDDWREMEGEIYYRLLCEAVTSARDSITDITAPHSFQSKLPSQLTDVQRSRLLRGYITLNNISDHVASKYGVKNCEGIDKVLRMDVLGILRIFAEQSRYSSEQENLTKLAEKIQENLLDYFL